MDSTDHEALLAGLDRLAGASVRRAEPVRFAVATRPAEREAIWRLRARTVIERGWAPASAFPDGMERDHHDDQAVLVAGWHGNAIVAAARLVFPSPGTLMPTEEAFDLTAEPTGQVANWDRMVVAPGRSDPAHRVITGLAARCWQEMRAYGYHCFIGCATPSTLRLYRRIGWIMTSLGPPRIYWGEERIPCRFDPRASFATPLPDGGLPAELPG